MKFQAQYIWTLLLTEHWKEADDLLASDLPESSPLFARFQYLRSYSLYHHHDRRASQVLKDAIETAHRSGDALTEADGLILLVEAEERKRPSGQALAERALAVARQNRLVFQEVNALDEVGIVELNQHRYADAIPNLLQAAERSRELKLHYLHLAALGDLVECYFSLGDLDRALRTLLAVVPLMHADEPSELRVSVNTELGSIYSLRQQDSAAVEAFKKAFEASAPLGLLSSYRIMSANNLAQALIQAHAFDEADKYNEVARAALTATPSPAPDLVADNKLNAADICAGRGELQQAETAYRSVLQILNKLPASSSHWSAYAHLAYVEERLHNIPQARSSFEMALAAIESNRAQQLSANFQITFLSSLIRFYQQYVQFLVDHNEPSAALSVADSSRAGVLTQGMSSSRTLPNFAAELERQSHATKTLLLFYWLAPNGSYLWAIAPDGIFLRRLPPSPIIEAKVKEYSKDIEGRRGDPLAESNPAGTGLYRILLAPIESHVKRDMRVVVVPDGALHGLNFETLIVPGGKAHYWVEDVTVTIAPSLRLLLDRPSSQTVARSALIVGDPQYAGSDFAAIPESKNEIAKVKARFPNSEVLTQEHAVVGSYQRVHPELFSLIHFSAHVDADPLSPLDSAIILSPDEYGRRRLYARDVMRNHLNADLVTVSGCRSTGARELSGEGMVGFAWAAFQAGAKNAVTSLWAVDDRSTADLMDNFYAGVSAGQSYAAALHEAKRKMLQTGFKKPYYWAPFQLYSRNLEVDRRP